MCPGDGFSVGENLLCKVKDFHIKCDFELLVFANFQRLVNFSLGIKIGGKT